MIEILAIKASKKSRLYLALAMISREKSIYCFDKLIHIFLPHANTEATFDHHHTSYHRL